MAFGEFALFPSKARQDFPVAFEGIVESFLALLLFEGRVCYSPFIALRAAIRQADGARNVVNNIDNVRGGDFPCGRTRHLPSHFTRPLPHLAPGSPGPP